MCSAAKPAGEKKIFVSLPMRKKPVKALEGGRSRVLGGWRHAMGAGKAHQARNQDADCDPSYVHQHMQEETGLGNTKWEKV